ncbi:unnamed protein product [Prunus armeniaca]|uniref:DUF7781 domain-containing protein n=1 Tax=Prunus armeniaca TaxID=36596 RepID=A0A6J5Y3L1_PRUAR|nr:unnamed protein product [Prunus armeniaca]
MDWGSNGEEPTSWEELYSINLIPSELFLKFRKEVQGLRVGLNLEFYNAPCNEFQGKLVLKPLAPERMWKFIYEPIHQDVRILSKKIPLTGYLNLQVGVGHNFSNECYWMEVETYYMFWWRWALGTGEPWFNMNSGKLQASLDRVETILTYTDIYNFYKPKDQDQQRPETDVTDVTTYSSG